MKSKSFFLTLLLTFVIFASLLVVTLQTKKTTISTPLAIPTVSPNQRALSGTLKKINPPAPSESGFDYLLVLDKKFQTTKDSLLIGASGLAPKTIVISIPNSTQKSDVSKLMNKHLEFTGIVKTGFAETSYLQVITFREIK